MKKILYLSSILLGACSLFVFPAENQCEEGSPEFSCNGNILVFCNQENNFQIREDCGAEQTCNPAASPPRCELNASTFCGDGAVQAPEECDDGNTDNGDSCEANCKTPDCGDGVLNSTNNEQCDDANQTDTDACNNNCQINISPGCGNGVVDSAEQCDTALVAPCDSNCTTPRCGNGLTSVDENNLPEACDDGNNINGDGCSSACVFEVTLPPFCGNGNSDAGEECDEGAALNDGTNCNANCTLPECGDSFLNPTEECDDGNLTDGDNCSSVCLFEITPPPIFCGDGNLDAGEGCDEGAANNDGTTCNANCTVPDCGDSFLNPAEECDDGNNIDGDGCDLACVFEVTPFCGDANVDAGEACDEGANNNGATCNADCTLPACGDGFLNPTEECDDDNTANGDGCSSVCIFENIFIGLCGDGAVDGGEECDDGNLLNADGCQASCLLPRCGDGVFDLDEVCFVPPDLLVSPGTVGASRTFTGDFNGDGFLDMGFASFDSSNASLFFGNGDGTFTGPLVLTAGLNPIRGAAGDLNEDGFDDVIISNHNGDNVFVYRSNGNGTFQAPSTLTGFDNPQGIAAKDLNRDGHLDLAIANRFGGNVRIFLGNGTGAFGAPLSTPNVGTEPREVEAIDFNNDGILDLATTANISGTATILRGVGDGTFASAFSDTLGGTTFNVQGIATGDINKDGLQDFAITRLANSDIFVYLNTGNFTFQRSGPFSSAGISVGNGIQMADINEDGQLEILVQGNNAAVAGRIVMLSFNAGSFTTSVFSFGQGIADLATEDFNRDGHLDLATPSTGTSGQVTLGFGFGDGTFTNQPRDLPATLANSQSMNITSGDLNNDGLPDLVVGAFFGARYAIYLNNNGTFSAPTLLTTGAEPRSAALADIDLDGDLDLVGMSTGENTSVLHFNNGNGSFGAPVVTNLGAGGLPKSVVVADMDHDGKPDLLYARDFLVGILRGNGNGTFQTVVNVAAGGRFGFMFVTDINKDGDLDLIGTSFLDTTLSVMRGNGNLAFQTEILLPTAFRPNRASVADFNGDGDLDIAAGLQDKSFFHFFSGNGDGTFGARQDIQATGFTVTGDSFPADINQDGDLDLVMGNDLTTAGGGSVGVLLGNGNGTFLPAVFAPIGGDLPTLTVADFNQDGQFDVATTTLNNITSLLFSFLH